MCDARINEKSIIIEGGDGSQVLGTPYLLLAPSRTQSGEKTYRASQLALHVTPMLKFSIVIVLGVANFFIPTRPLSTLTRRKNLRRERDMYSPRHRTKTPH